MKPPPQVNRESLLRILKIERELEKRASALSFYAFVRKFWHVIEPSTPFVDGWHINAICLHLEAVKDFNIAKLIINMPPRHMKSILVSVMFPAWVWLRNPERRFIYCSYSEALAVRDSIKTRMLIDSDEYQEMVLYMGRNFDVKPWRLKDDSNQKKLFENTATGSRLSVGVGGGLTGQGGDYLFIDDPLNAVDASSEAALESVNLWHDVAFATRYNDPKRHAKVIVMQRLHEQDLTGHVLEKTAGEYERLILPARYEGTSELTSRTSLNWVDPRTKEGELLWPERFSETLLKDLEDDLNRFNDSAEAQLQQNPKSKKGALFLDESWGEYEASPSNILEIVQFWDCAQKPGISNDFSVCSTWARTGVEFYILDVLEMKTDAPLLESLAVSQAQRFKPDAIVIEDKSAGSSLIQYLLRNTELPVIPYLPLRDKVVRATAATPTIKAGKVKLPKGADWVKGFKKQHSSFPKVKHDDMVDTTSMAVEYFLKRGGSEPRVRSI